MGSCWCETSSMSPFVLVATSPAIFLKMSHTHSTGGQALWRSWFEVLYSPAGSGCLMSAFPCGWHWISPKGSHGEADSSTSVAFCLSPKHPLAWIPNHCLDLAHKEHLNWVLFYRLLDGQEGDNYIFSPWLNSINCYWSTAVILEPLVLRQTSVRHLMSSGKLLHMTSATNNELNKPTFKCASNNRLRHWGLEDILLHNFSIRGKHTLNRPYCDFIFL